MVMIEQVRNGLVTYDHSGSSSSDADLHELVSSKISRELLMRIKLIRSIYSNS